MAKYLILFNAPLPASKFMAQSSPEQRQAGMDSWMAWKEEADKTVKFEFGMPIEAVSRITPEGTTESDNVASGYAIIEGDREAVVKALETHPHLKRPDATIDLLEMLSMPGQ
jgi:hypothetical protein